MPRLWSPDMGEPGETRFSEKYPTSVYIVISNNSVTRVEKFSRYAAKTDGVLLCVIRGDSRRRTRSPSGLPRSREDE
jgi:hypothetical protein